VQLLSKQAPARGIHTQQRRPRVYCSIELRGGRFFDAIPRAHLSLAARLSEFRVDKLQHVPMTFVQQSIGLPVGPELPV